MGSTPTLANFFFQHVALPSIKSLDWYRQSKRDECCNSETRFALNMNETQIKNNMQILQGLATIQIHQEQVLYDLDGAPLLEIYKNFKFQLTSTAWFATP